MDFPQLDSLDYRCDSSVDFRNQTAPQKRQAGSQFIPIIQMEFDAPIPFVKHGLREPYLVNRRQFYEVCSSRLDFFENSAFAQWKSITLQKQNAALCFRTCEFFKFLPKRSLYYQAQCLVLVLTPKREYTSMRRCCIYPRVKRSEHCVPNRTAMLGLSDRK